MNQPAALYLFCMPEELEDTRKRGFVPAARCYRTNAEGRLERRGAAAAGCGAVMVVSLKMWSVDTDLGRLSRQILIELEKNTFTGVVFEECEAARLQLPGLVQKITGQQASVWLPAAHAPGLEAVGALVSSMLSGGSYREMVHHAAKRFSSHAALMLEPLRNEFPIPFSDPDGKRLTLRELETAVLEGMTFYNKELCAKYMTRFSQSKPCFLLYDDETTITEKLEIAGDEGIGTVFCERREALAFEDALRDFFNRKARRSPAEKQS